ncbi:MAG: RsmB/NOP family class I SAM-dependent RNA methyltransferase [Bdellovibrionales bacterium]|nr:RsmB/NOP family class I SAM-dependent RNA methyltransferase [Bdellovibrionales bacterium]
MARSSRQGSSSRSKSTSNSGSKIVPRSDSGSEPSKRKPGSFDRSDVFPQSKIKPSPSARPSAKPPGRSRPTENVRADDVHGPQSNPFRQEVRPDRGGFFVHRPVAQIAVDALATIVLEGRYADKVIEKAFKSQKNMGARDRKQFAEIVYDLIRWWRRSGAAIGWDTEVSTPSREDLWKWLAVLIVEKSVKDGHEPTLPNWPEFQDLSATKIANTLSEIDPVKDRAIFESVPDWLDKLGQKELGQKWPQTLHALNLPAPVFLRANTLKCTRDELIARLKEEESVSALPAHETANGVILSERKNLFSSKAFQEGWFEVQDGASQLVAEMLGAVPGDRVIDACAGAGGKTLAIGAMMKNKGRLIALDIHEIKLQELRRRVARSGIDTSEARLIDSAKVIKRLENSADRVLLDVPCSGTGVFRRNPDAKWKLKPEDIERLLVLQAQILDEYTSMVKPGGVVVYATCSCLPSENRKQVDAFLKRRQTLKASGAAQFELVRDRDFAPGNNRYDGFYAAVLKRI